MDAVKGKGKKNLLVKTWERCRSIPGRREKSPPNPSSSLSRSKSWDSTNTTQSPKPNPKRGGDTKNSRSHRRSQVAPEGCFCVYVGPEKQRFVVKTKYASHPLFKMLLEDAETEYGYSSDGPIMLPCDVDLFYKVLAEMDAKEGNNLRTSWGFAYGSCSPFKPYRRLGNTAMAELYGSGSYGLLTPSRLLKMNQF